MYLSLLKMNYDGADLLRLTPLSWIICLLSPELLEEVSTRFNALPDRNASTPISKVLTAAKSNAEAVPITSGA
jgi:hypothetical protein